MSDELSALCLVPSTMKMQHKEQLREWRVQGVARTALIFLPTKTEGAPVVFGFHGHGGNGRNSARRWKLHTHWPEAIVIYPNGLPTRTPRDPEGGKPGWQMFGGGLLPNRDLEFFTALLETAKREWKIDEKRIYCTGHSNGGGFTYYLWGQRPELFAALGVVAAAGGRLLARAKPCPLLHIGAKNDTIVTWESQQAAIDAAKRINGTKAPVEVIVHSEGHAYPERAGEQIMTFFKKYPEASKL